jgi:hypothetical protein
LNFLFLWLENNKRTAEATLVGFTAVTMTTSKTFLYFLKDCTPAHPRELGKGEDQELKTICASLTPQISAGQTVFVRRACHTFFTCQINPGPNHAVLFQRKRGHNGWRTYILLWVSRRTRELRHPFGSDPSRKGNRSRFGACRCRRIDDPQPPLDRLSHILHVRVRQRHPPGPPHRRPTKVPVKTSSSAFFSLEQLLQRQYGWGCSGCDTGGCSNERNCVRTLGVS